MLLLNGSSRISERQDRSSPFPPKKKRMIVARRARTSFASPYKWNVRHHSTLQFDQHNKPSFSSNGQQGFGTSRASRAYDAQCELHLITWLWLKRTKQNTDLIFGQYSGEIKDLSEQRSFPPAPKELTHMDWGTWAWSAKWPWPLAPKYHRQLCKDDDADERSNLNIVISAQKQIL